ncbi:MULTISPECIES: DUF1127 domain-containing protein [Hyphomicrobiales]|jgi:uncharacterized protein YjiS (DUF1127 family)|uniref:DUF1127 domain-containing protein n=1 Tax=Hyphomicrobiales TaxID=356 RepID=UPI0005901203|nr:MULTISPECIES: DUF1127 domain-containing protein [Phyllobacteriaceae]MCX8568022.1 DUF1127 domain-containing protein [Aminobacter sp. MET-1]
MSTIDAIGGGAIGASGQQKRGALGVLTVAPLRMIRWLGRCMERRRTRLSLLELTDEQLADIGISRCDAYREGLRPFYD